MKRSVLIALAAFALAGCAKESVVDSALTNAGNAIGFNTYSNITRGNPFDNNPEFAASGNVFGVTAFISTSDSPYMGKADAGTEIVSDGTKWDYKNTSDIRYWPTQGETLSFYAYAPYKMEYPINRFAMEVKRQMDVLDKRLANNRYLAGDEYTIADIAVWPWYGNLAMGIQYDAGEFLQVQDYTHVQRWTKEIAQRPAAQRGRMVNRVTGKPESQLHERHDASDFQTKVQKS